MTRAVLLSLVICFFFQINLDSAQAQIPTSHKLEVMGLAQQKGPLQPGQNINLLVWNIHKADDIQWFTDIKNLIANKDFSLFQEAVYPQTMVDFFSELGRFEWAMATSYRLINKDLSGTGVTTASKIKSLHQDVLSTISTEPVVSTPKISLYTTYAINIAGKKSEKELLVANIHAINFVSNFTYFIELLRIEKRLAQHKGPIILAGDFNTWSESRIKYLNKMAERRGLTAVPFTETERRITMGHPLDHVYYRDLKMISKEDLSYITSSDHIPLSVQFQLEQN